MTSVAVQNALGWADSGAPGSDREMSWKLKNLRRVSVVKRVKTLWVHKAILPMASALILFLQRNGENLARVVDDWGFANRAIRGSGGGWRNLSYHKFARALDVNATENPQHSHKTTFPVKKTREVCKLLGFEWGFDFNPPWQDPMHFQWPGSRLRARYIRGRLKKVNKRTRRLAELCNLDVDEFIERIH